jgi:hypothetical protein
MEGTIRPWGRRRSDGGTWAVVAGGVATVVVVVAVGLARPAVTPEPAPRPGTASTAPGVGPVVYSEIVDADGSVLVERRLDGQSLPRRVASGPSRGRADLVGRSRPDRRRAAVAGRAGWRLDAVSIVDGSELWTVDIAGVDLGEAVWSSDGHRLALIDRPEDAGPTQRSSSTSATAHGVRTILPDDAVLQASTPTTRSSSVSACRRSRVSVGASSGSIRRPTRSSGRRRCRRSVPASATTETSIPATAWPSSRPRRRTS